MSEYTAHKKCIRCKINFSLDRFSKQRRASSGLHPMCKACDTETIKKWRLNHPFYACWKLMISRCSHCDNKSYKNYGGRGISVCDQWKHPDSGYKNYCHFRIGLGDSTESNLSLDRKDNNGNYCPENCRLATRSEQNSNQRKRKARKSVPQSKYIGVSWKTQSMKWVAQPVINGVRYRIGLFLDEESANSAIKTLKQSIVEMVPELIRKAGANPCTGR